MHALVDEVARYGLPLVFLNVAAEQLGLPVPALPTLVVAGALVAEGRIGWLPLLSVAMVASLLADAVWYAIGRRHGYRVLATLCRLSLSPDTCVRNTESTFERMGMPSLLFAKFVPGFSTVAPPLAGATGAPLASFLIYDSLGTLMWSGLGIGAGAVFHDAIEDALAVLGRLGGGALAVLAALLLAFIAAKWWRRRQLTRLLALSRITPHELRSLIDAEGDALVLDVRSRSVRRRDPRRIPGSVVIELDELERVVATLPHDREVVLYCT
jgi:membrane protein DedA with SNARE-associated domain